MHRIICLFSALLCAALPVFAQNTTTTPALPTDFPKFVNTGDTKADNARYDAAKKDWVEANPKAYARLVGIEEVITKPAEQEKTSPTLPPAPENSTANSPAPTNTEPAHPLPDHYPRIVATGNIAADEAAHIKAKNEWIKNYPQEYQKMGGNPNDASGIPNNEQAIAPPKVASIVLPPFEAQKKYKLIRYEVLAANGSQPTDAQIEEETQKLENDFIGYGTELQIADNHQIRLYEPNKLDLRAIETINDKDITWFFDNKECETCAKTIYLTIEKQSDTIISYIMQSEDEGALFAYRISFQLITKP